jgi:Domain of unknown function (DUF4062)
LPESVYISSTYEDLQEFRQAVINCIISLKEFYLPTSMEFYDAEDQHFVTKCLNDVEACDVYVLILGKRYGYMPKGETKSITELEYERAKLCQKEGKSIEILVFKAGELCADYNYMEKNEKFVQYQQAFLDQVTERVSRKPFESKAELEFQVSHALMKRLFSRLKLGERIVPPDKDAALCFCDRHTPINDLKDGVLKKKRIFFLYGKRRTDHPVGVLKRFAKYSLGFSNKIEPPMNIANLFTSCHTGNNYSYALRSILTYMGIAVDEGLEVIAPVDCLRELNRLNSPKLILPFYYNFDYSEDAHKFQDFIAVLDLLLQQYNTDKPAYQLYFMIFIYSAQPDENTIRDFLKEHDALVGSTAFVQRLGPVLEDDILDWMEVFITSSEFSASLYGAYFEGQYRYDMQDVNLKLSEIIDDLGKGSEKIKKYL